MTTIHDPQFVPITWQFDKTGRKARVSVAGFIETESAPLKISATDDEQQVVVQMPNGMEYKEYAAAQCTILKGTGPVKFDYTGRHSSLADVDHSNKGLQA